MMTAVFADRFSAANFAMIVPWNESLKQMRKANSCTVVPSHVTSSAVAEPETTGTWFFAVTTFNSVGAESDFSSVASTTIGT